MTWACLKNSKHHPQNFRHIKPLNPLNCPMGLESLSSHCAQGHRIASQLCQKQNPCCQAPQPAMVPEGYANSFIAHSFIFLEPSTAKNTKDEVPNTSILCGLKASSENLMERLLSDFHPPFLLFSASFSSPELLVLHAVSVVHFTLTFPILRWKSLQYVG